MKQTTSRKTAARSNVRSVREIEHSSIDHVFFSCDQIRYRVKSDLKFGCSISLINKRRSTTDLNSDRRTQLLIVKTQGRQVSRTLRFCGIVPAASAEHRGPSQSLSSKAPFSAFPSNAGASPAFAIERSASASPAVRADLLPRAAAKPRLHLARRSVRLRGTEFISVSGYRPERSALHSDVRLKRHSGSAAAPALPHAPMNSPAALRAGFPSQSLVH